MKLKLNQEEIQELHITRNKDGTFNIHCETTPYKKKYNEELTDEIFVDMPVEEIAQVLLNFATVTSIEDISNLFIKNMMIGGMEEDE